MISFTACGMGNDFKETESGLKYKFHVDEKGDMPSIDNILKLQLAYRTSDDSLVYNSVTDNPRPTFITLQPSEYNADIYEGFRMMSKGDSVTFFLDANEFFTQTIKSPRVPPFISEGDSIYVDVLLEEFFTEEGFAEYNEQLREEQLQEEEVKAQEESRILDNYLMDNNITVEPEESGLIIIVDEEGSGPKPEPGQSVTVHYTGTNLEGEKFDSSRDRGEPFSFTLGQGQVIRGWDEGISKLNVGSKATLIIPSHLAYGNQQRGPVITPFSTLIFDIELIDAE